MKQLIKYFTIVVFLHQGLIAFSSGNCTNTSAFGTATAPTTTASVTISTCSYQTEYSTVNSVVAGNTYVLTNSCGGYITVHSGTYNGTIVAQGNSPLTFTATTSGTYYPSWNTGSNCGTATNCCTTTIQCTSCGGGGAGTGCTNTSSFGSATAPTTNTTTTISTCNYQTEYSTINSVVAGNTYSLGSSCGGYVTIHSGTYNGPVVASGNAPLSWTAATSGTYYVSWNTNSSCGTATSCCTTTIQCTSCSSGGGGGTGGCVSLNGNSNCTAADPFCTNSGLNFCNTTNVASLGGGGVYGCLGSTPNPSFFYLNIANSGSLTMTLNQTTSAGSGIDVDYIIWGPFSSQNAMCAGYSASNIVSCSFSAAAIETATIPNAVTGQWYLMLITNYSNQSGAVSFTQTSGTGSTNCNILCNMTGLTATPGTCNSTTNQYSVTGTISFTYPPTSGTLTVSSSCGGSTTIPGPWTSPLNYSLSGITANGGACSITAVFSADPTCTLTQPYTAPPSCNTCASTAVPTQPNCNGGTGSILVTATSGNAGFNVSWSGTSSGNPGGTEISALNGTYTIPNLAPGTYTVTVTAANGCVSTNTVTISNPPAVTASNTPTNATCNGATNGSAVITASGGSPGYNVSWTGTTSGNPAGTEIASSGGTYSMTGLGAGTYNVTVSASNGCTATTTVTITAPAGVTASNTPTPATCSGATNGSAVITASGGTAGYNVSWTGATSGNPAGTEIAASGGTYTMGTLGAGTYNVTVTDVNNCTTTTTVTITAPVGVTASNTATNATCNGATNGSAVITASGGTAGYNVSWTGTTSGNPAGTEIAASGGTYTMGTLGAGTYNVTVTDVNNCTATTTVTITAPVGVTASNTPTNATCNGATNGSAVITASGGTAGYNVSWTGTTSGNPAGTEIAASGGTYTMGTLGAGTYNVTVTDVNNCTTTTTVTITAPIGVTASNTPTNATCNGSTNGSAVITASGGTAGYNVSWTGTSSGNPAGTEIAASGGTYTMGTLGAGTYNVTVTDVNNCTTTTTVTITAPAGVTASNTPTPATCNGATNGSAVITASGGTAGYNVSWTGTTSGNPAGTEIAASGGTYSMTGLGAGTYNLTITDANNCAVTTTVTITDPVIPPAPVVACYETATWNGTSCTYDITGTQPPAPVVACYETATWNATSCTYDITGTQPPAPVVACYETATWNGTSCTYDITGTQPPAPVVACYETATWNGTTCVWDVTGTAPSVLITSTLSTINLAQSSQLTAIGTPTGGTYTWSPSTGLDNTTGSVVNASPITTTTYTVTYDIGNNCTATATTTIIVNAVTLSVNSATICSGSSATLTATPSVAGGTYLWSPGGQITQSITVSPLTNTVYTCVYTLNGVSTSPTVGTVTVNQTPTVSLNTPTICSGQSATLSATVAPPGGTYLWQPGGQVTPSITVSPSTTSTYSLTYTLNGCSATASSTVTVNPTPTVSVNSSTVCSGESATLTATVTPAGGTLLWGNSQSTSSITVSPTTTTNYNVLYTLNGCNATGSGTVTVNAVPTVSVSSATVCSGQSATLTATPSAGGGTYAWVNNASTTNTISVTPTATSSYSVTYTLNGCTSQSASGTVVVNQIPTVSVNNAVICIGESATLTASSSTAGGTYVWTPNGETTNAVTVTPTATSSYSVTYTLNGCTSQSATGTVTVNPLPTVSFSGDQLTGCAPLTVNFASTGGNPSNCSWSMGNGQTVSGCTPSYTFTQGGCYDITLTTTENGCTNTATLQDYICVENPPVASFTTNPTIFTEPIQVVTFDNNTVGASTYIWEFGDGQSSTEENPVHTYTSTTNGAVITLTAISALGCEDTYQVSIQFEEGEIIYIPNTFTPDGDNFNQMFLPVFTSGFDPYNFEMLIFNRWGEIIFETHDANMGWDGSYGTKGRDVQEGVYTYKIIYKNPLNDKRKIIVGHVSLIK